MRRRIERSALLMFPARDVCALVADIDRYSEFVPHCAISQVLCAQGAEVVARLDVTVAGRREKLVTRNRRIGDQAIVIDLVEGPFSDFSGQWRFKPLGDVGCRADLILRFEFASRILSAFTQPFLDRAADSVFDAFATRAKAVLGGLEKVP